MSFLESLLAEHTAAADTAIKTMTMIVLVFILFRLKREKQTYCLRTTTVSIYFPARKTFESGGKISDSNLSEGKAPGHLS